MNEVLKTIMDLMTLIFIITSMLSVGLGLTAKQMLEPLKNIRFVILSLVANFIIIPAAAFLLITFLPLDRPLQIGIMILACAAGAPVLPELVKIAKGDVAASVGLIIMLLAVTIIFLPIVLPLMLPGIKIGIWAVAKNLLLLMLAPLAVAMFVRARWKEIAEKLERIFARASNYSLILLMVLMLVVKWQYIISKFGSFGILASFILVVIGFGSGYLLGGPSTSAKRVLSLGTAQRNIAAAMIVANYNFYNEVLIMVVVFKVISLILAIPLAVEWGRRSRKALAAGSIEKKK